MRNTLSMAAAEKLLKKEKYLQSVKAHKNARAAYEASRTQSFKIVEKVGTTPTAYDNPMARAFAKAGYVK